MNVFWYKSVSRFYKYDETSLTERKKWKIRVNTDDKIFSGFEPDDRVRDGP
jgi:hypothetical protein